MVLRLLAVRRPQNRVRHVKKQVGRQSLMHFGAKNDGFMINLRFDLGEKSRGVVKPLFSPMPKGDGREIFSYGRAVARYRVVPRKCSARSRVGDAGL